MSNKSNKNTKNVGLKPNLRTTYIITIHVDINGTERKWHLLFIEIFFYPTKIVLFNGYRSKTQPTDYKMF